MKVLIVGFGGQDATLLRKYLLDNGNEVFSISSRISASSREVVNCDLESRDQISSLIREMKPDEIYYLAAVSLPEETRHLSRFDSYTQNFTVNTVGFINVLEACQEFSSKSKIFYACSSHVFEPSFDALNELSPMVPRGDYAISKATSRWIAADFVEKYGLSVHCGILFNHESALRQNGFLSKKVIDAGIALSRGESIVLQVNDLNSKVDWGYAPYFVKGFVGLTRDAPSGDYIMSSGEIHSVENFISVVGETLGVDLLSRVESPSNLGIEKAPYRLGDPAKIAAAIGWRPRPAFEKFIEMLVDDYMQNRDHASKM